MERNLPILEGYFAKKKEISNHSEGDYFLTSGSTGLQTNF